MPPPTQTRRTILISVTLALAGPVVVAQDPLKQDAKEIGALLRTKGYSGAAVQILTQLRFPQPRARLDAIADTLAEIAVSYLGEDIRSAQVRAAATDALISAAIGREGIPYSGAPERLLRIIERESPVAGGALSGLTRIGDKQLARQYLRRIATSQNSYAFGAVRALAESMGPEGLALLRQLYLQGAITQPHAQEELVGVAAYYKWKP